MITVEDYEAIRRVYYLEKKSIRQIAKEQHHSHRTIRKAIQQVQPHPYFRTIPKPAPIFGSRFQERVGELLTKNRTLPPKQHYSARKIYETLVAEGYQGSESIPARGEFRSHSLSSHVCPRRKEECQQFKEHPTQITSSFVQIDYIRVRK